MNILQKLLSPREATSTEGRIGNDIFNGLYYGRSQRPVPKLTGLSRFKTFDKIHRQLAVVAMSITWYLDLIGAAQWNLEAAEGDEDERVKDLFQQILFEDSATSWEDINKYAAMSRFFGFALQEITARRQDDGSYTLQDIAPRPQNTIESWRIEEGVLVAANQSVNGRRVEIPIEKLIYIANRAIETGPEGQGLFDVIASDAIRLMDLIKTLDFGFERDLRGIPIGRVPAAEIEEQTSNLTEDEKASVVQALVKPVVDAVKLWRRTDNETGLLLESETHSYEDKDGVQKPTAVRKYDIDLLRGDAQGLKEVQQEVTYLNQNIARALGTEARLLGSSSAGSYALSRDKTDQFSLAIEAQLRDNRREFQRKLIPLFGRLNNIPEELYPILVVESPENYDPVNTNNTLNIISQSLGGLPPELINQALAQIGFNPLSDEQMQTISINSSLLDNPPEDEE